MRTLHPQSKSHSDLCSSCQENVIAADYYLQEKGRNVPAAVRALFARKLLKKVAEAYGRMLLIKGLFQADCHPGNILIRDDNGLGALSQGRTLTMVSLLLFT